MITKPEGGNAAKRNEKMDDDSFHLRKGFALMLVSMLAANLIATVWWAASVSGRLDRAETDIVRHAVVPSHGNVRVELAELKALVRTGFDALKEDNARQDEWIRRVWDNMDALNNGKRGGLDLRPLGRPPG